MRRFRHARCVSKGMQTLRIADQGFPGEFRERLHEVRMLRLNLLLMCERVLEFDQSCRGAVWIGQHGLHRLNQLGLLLPEGLLDLSLLNQIRVHAPPKRVVKPGKCPPPQRGHTLGRIS